MSPGIIILLIFFAGAALIALITVPLFRLITNALGIKQVLEDGVALTENGLEFLGFGFLGPNKVTINYRDIESVELMPYYKSLLTILMPRFDSSVRWIRRRPFNQMVIVKFKGPQVYKKLHFTPKDPLAFAEQLKSRIEPNVGTPKT